MARKVKHGHTSKAANPTPTYTSWYSMIRRCSGKSKDHIEGYFNKNITVCERWTVFSNFLEDMGLRPSIKHTLDRFPNNTGNYEPGNVRWATQKEQSNNLTTNLLVTYRKRQQTLVKWCEELGLNYFRMRERIFMKGMKPADAFTLPKRYDKMKSNFISYSFGLVAA